MNIDSKEVNIKFVEIKDVSSREFKEAIKIYIDSFPPNERQPIDVVERRVKNNLYQMFVGMVDDVVVFMAFLYPLRGTPFILFDYMATREDYRNKGIGTKFVNMLIDRMRKDNKYLILEVEDPCYGDNKEQRKRRVNFYKRLGAKQMKDVKYVLPPLSGETPTQMILMILPKYNEGKISGQLVKEIITRIYEEVYSRGKNDPLLKSFIDTVGDVVDLV